MNEQERAAYYEAHRGDDADEWDEPEPEPAKPRRRLASMISVRLTPEEVDAVREAARQSGTSVSAFMREAALARAEGRERPGERGCDSSAVEAEPSYVAVTLVSIPLAPGVDLTNLGGGRGLVQPGAA
jgi:hypothetical protein